MKLPFIQYNCRHFLGEMPCYANKEHGIFCENCSYFERDENTYWDFPEIEPAPKEKIIIKNGRIIIIKLDAIGDVLRTTSILPSLKKKYPDSIIEWITKAKSYPILKDNELISKIHILENGLESISKESSIAVNLDSGTESCVVMNQIDSEIKYGYQLRNNKPYPVNELASEWYLMSINDKFKKSNTKTYYKIIHEICGLEYEGVPPILNMSADRKKRAAEISSDYGLSRFNGFVLINLGGGTRWQYKKWTKEGYSELINRLASLEHQKAVGVIAGQEDKDFYNDVLSLIVLRKNIILFGCDNPVEDFICIVYLADKVLTSDSLAFHIATALGNFVVVIVGPTSYTELDVFGKGKIVYSKKVDCLVCYLNKCDEVVTCMNTIYAQEILALLR